LAIIKLQKLQILRIKTEEEAINLGYVTAEDYDLWVKPEDMVGTLK